MIRTFVNIVAEIGSSRMYSLHRLDVSKHLFHPSTAAAEAANKTNGKVKVSILPWLPATVMRFEPSPTTLWDDTRMEMFALVSPRSCEDRILCSNSAGYSMVYHAELNCIQIMPSHNGDKGFRPMVISIARPGAPEEDLYVMNTNISSCFDVLRYGSIGGELEEESPLSVRGWRWDPLPPPPIAARIRSHTVVDGGSTICVSAGPSSGAGTYCFDTVKREWTQVAGGWSLPLMAQRSTFLTSSCGWASPLTASNCVLGTSLPWTNHRH